MTMIFYVPKQAITMKIFVVALALLITASNTDQFEQIPQELDKLLAPIAHLNTPDQNGPNFEDDKDVNALNKNQPQAVQRNLNSRNDNDLFKIAIYNRIRKIIQKIPNLYEFSNYSLSTYQGKELKESNESCHGRIVLETRLEALESRCSDLLVDASVVDGVVKQLKRELNDQGLMANDVVITNLPASQSESPVHLYICVQMIFWLCDHGFDASLQYLAIQGLSNINIDNINVKNCEKQATIIITVPKVDVHFGNAGVDLTVFDSKLLQANNGTISVNNIVIVIDVYIKHGQDTITYLGISLNFVGSVQSNLYVTLFGLDISGAANDFIVKIIPSILEENKLQLQEILRDIILQDLNGAL